MDKHNHATLTSNRDSNGHQDKQHDSNRLQRLIQSTEHSKCHTFPIKFNIPCKQHFQETTRQRRHHYRMEFL